METKNLLTRSVEEISTTQLSQLHSAITNELDHRRSRAKETAWNKLVDAIKDYTTTFGNIDVAGVYETLCVDSLDDFSSVGRIEIKFD